MEKQYFEDQDFDKRNFFEEVLITGDYEGCSFSNCNFSNANLHNFHFIDCVFDGCNLSNAKLDNTAIKDVQFKNCKMLGLLFLDCDSFLFSANFENCT